MGIEHRERGKREDKEDNRERVAKRRNFNCKGIFSKPVSSDIMSFIPEH